MPKKSPAAHPPVLTFKQRSRWEKERRRQWIVFFSGSVVISLIVGLLGYGFVNSQVAPRWQPAVQVNDASFNLAYVAQYLQAVLGDRKKEAAAVNATASGLVLQIQNSELIRQAAQKSNISVTAEDLNQAIREGLTTSEEKDKVDDAEIQRRYQRRLAGLKISDAFYRELVAADVFLRKWRERLESQVPTQAEQANLQIIKLDTEEDARQVRSKLDSGGDFAALAKEFSKDEATKEKSGELGWVPRGLHPELDEASFSLPLATPSQPIATPQGRYILLVKERQDSRPIAEEALKTLKARALDQWLEQARKDNIVKDLLTDDQTALIQPRALNWIMAQLK